MNTPCYDEKLCFARQHTRCTILHTAYRKGKCPFCKPQRDMTRGVHYPIDPNYRPMGGDKN